MLNQFFYKIKYYEEKIQINKKYSKEDKLNETSGKIHTHIL